MLGGGGTQEMFITTTYTQLQTILSSQRVQHLTELFFTSQKLMVKKLELMKSASILKKKTKICFMNKSQDLRKI